jgi:hypothetical protein
MGRWNGSGGLVLWIDIDPAMQDEADAWYLDEHLPERVQVAGYRSARRYVAIEATPRYLSVFEADTPEALASPGYLGLVSRISEQSRRIRAAFRDVVRNTFEVTASQGRARGGVVGSFRLQPASADRRAADAALSTLVENLAHMPGVVAAHALKAAPHIRARLDAVRVTGQSDATAEQVLLIEATGPAELARLRLGPTSDAALMRSGWQVEAYGTYRLMAEFS